jgi:WD40 repeat protein
MLLGGRRGFQATLSWFALAVLALFPLAAIADSPASDPAPILRIETGVHGAVINHVAVDDASGRIVTVSDDKTTRVWSMADGSLQHVWRTPIGRGDAGALYAAALHGDDLVVGGYTGDNDGTIYVFNLKTGTLRGSIDKFKGAITALAFSPDGHILAIADEAPSLHLIDFTALKPKAADQSYGGRINRIAFAGDGRVATTAQDGEIRVLDGDLKELARGKLKNPDDKPWGVTFSPEGSQLVVGNRDRAEVQVFAAATLKPLQTLHGAAGDPGDLSVVAWSADNKVLAAAGSYRRGDETRLIRLWPITASGLGTPVDTPIATDTVTDLALTQQDDIVYGTAEPTLGMLYANGTEHWTDHSRHADFRDGRQQFLLSPDATVVEFPTGKGGKTRYRFDLIEGSLTKNPPPRNDLKPGIVQDSTLVPTDWQNSTAPKLGSRAVALEPNEHARALAVLPAAAGAVFGTDFYLRAEGPQGPLWKTVVPAPVWVLNASADGRYVVAGLGDGTIRWYAPADGHEVMSLFVDPVDERWVVWLPEGFFDHSQLPGKPGGETLVGYQINRGPSHLADFIEIGQLYAKFARRDLVVARLRGDSAQQALVDSQTAKAGDFRAVLQSGAAPAIKLLDYCIVADAAPNCPAKTAAPPQADAKTLEVAGPGTALFARYELDDRGGGIGPAIISRNGAVIEGTRSVEQTADKRRVETVLVALQPSGNTITFGSKSANGEVETASDQIITLNAKLTGAPETSGGAAVPNLYAVVVGVSDYRQPDFKLANADSDARALADLLSKPSPPAYAVPFVKPLVNEDATKANILAAISDVAAKARPEDIVVIFFAGHGEAVDKNFYFAPVEFATGNPQLVDEAKHSDRARQGEIIDELFRKEGVASTDLFPIWAKIQGNMLIILDTCFSANTAIPDAVAKAAHNDAMADGIEHDTGRFIIAGARAEALDSPGGTENTVGGNHGLFTYWLLQGLEGHDPDIIRKGKIDVIDLMRYTKDKVAEESRKIHQDQVPKMQLGGNDGFPVQAIKPAN